MTEQEITMIETAYFTLLHLPAASSAWRAANQPVFAALRDALAEAYGRDAQEVQDHFEALASCDLMLLRPLFPKVSA